MGLGYSCTYPQFTTDDTLGLRQFEKKLNALLAVGVNGIILGGTLGEARVLSTDEN